MEQVVSAVFNYKNEKPLELLPVVDATEAKTMPSRFFLPEAGFYAIGDKVYLLDKEGLYRFFDETGAKRQYCLYKNDVQALVASILWCCDFSGQVLPIGQHEILEFRLPNNDIKELWPTEALRLLLGVKSIPTRVEGWYSVTEKKTAALFLEVWDEGENSWVLYWMEKNSCVKTSAKNTFVDVFEKMLCGETLFERVAGEKKLQHTIFTVEQDQSMFIKSLDDPVSLAAFAREKEFVPFIMRNFSAVEVHTQEEYKKFFTGKDSVVRSVSGEKYPLVFMADASLREEFYGPQIHVMGKAIKKINWPDR